MENPWKGLKGQIYLGSPHFVEEMQKHIQPDQPLQENPLRQPRRMARLLANYTEHFANRHQAIAEAYLTGAYIMQIISASAG